MMLHQNHLHWPPRWVLHGRTAVVIALVLALVVAACSRPSDGAVEKNDVLIVETRPVPLDFSTPERSTIGRLRYRGGLALRLGDERFGGLSGLLVRPDGGAFTAVSDNGYWIGANLIYEPKSGGWGLAKLGYLVDSVRNVEACRSSPGSPCG